MSYLQRLTTRRPPQSAPLPGRPGPEQRRRLRLGGRRLDAPAPLPDPRLGGRQLLRRRADAHPRERRRGRALPRRRRRCARSRRSSRSATRGRAPKNDPAVFALALAAGARRRGDAACRARGAAARVPHGHAPVPVRARSSRASAAGAARSVARSAAGTRRARSTRSPTRRSSTASARASRTATCCGWPTRRQRVSAGNPTLDVSAEHRALFEWIVRGGSTDGLPRIVEGFALAQAAETPAATAELVREYGLPREALASEHLTSPEVWEALLDDMPMTALVRNLATMTRVGVLRARARRHRDGDRSGSATASGSARRGCTRSRCSRRSAHVRVGSRRARPRHVDAGAAGRRRARRRVLHGVRERRADRQAAAAGARRVGLDGLGIGCRRSGPHPARRLGRARARDGGDASRATRSSASSPAVAAGRAAHGGPRSGACGRHHAARDQPAAAAGRRRAAGVATCRSAATDCALPMLYAHGRRRSRSTRS